MWIFLSSDENNERSLMREIRSGQAGFPSRLGLSLITGFALAALMFLCLGLIEAAGIIRYVDEEHIAAGMVVAGLLWCISLVWIWNSYRRLGPYIRMILLVIGVWVVMIPLAILLASTTRQEEMLVTAVFLAGFAATTYVILMTLYRGYRGRPLTTSHGEINVRCPTCGYSMVGLRECQCPECGESFTIDSLIRAQDYDAVLRSGRPAKKPQGSGEPLEPAPTAPGSSAIPG